MNISLNPGIPLAHLYRQARALASAEAAQMEDALALSAASAAVFGERGGETGPSSGRDPAERKRDQVRRAVIAALRHQALMARRTWMAHGGAEADPEAQKLLQQAEAVADAALRLHHAADAGRTETAYVLRFLRSTSAIAATPRKPLPVAPPAPVEAAPTPASTAAPPLPETEGPRMPRARAARPKKETAAAPASRLRPALVAGLAVIALTGFAAGVVTAPRLLGPGRAAKTESSAVTVPAARPAVAVPPSAAPKVAPSVAPRSAAGPVSRPTARPVPPVVLVSSGPTVALVVRSDPSGAQVYIGGALRGTTPLRVQARPGGVIAVLVRRGSRVWRGIVQVGQISGQVVTVRLPPPLPAVAQAAPTPAAPAAPAPTATPSVRAHYEALMTQGVDLYRSGWYGPAMGRFKQATAVVPGSPRAYLWLGRAAVKAGRLSEGRRALEKVVALAPGSDAAREAQALLNRLRLAERGT